MKHIIHTSERKDFKRCRQLWDFRSPNRLNLSPNTEARALALGTAVHAGLEVYYDPDTWAADRAAVEALSVIAFKNALPAPEGFLDDWESDLKLGVGMLKHYFEIAPTQDAELTPMYAEIKFEVEIPNMVCGHNYSEQTEDGFVEHDRNVYYAGRIDLIVEDKFGGLWIVDHKTAATFQPDEFLVFDEQITSYCWAVQHMLGVKVEGFIYNELRKDVPHKPDVLKNGTLSKNKSQNTTYELYLTAIQEGGYPVSLYSDILEHFQNQGNKFFRRTFVHRSPKELELAGERIVLEAADMLGDPSIYPNADRHCSYCAFKSPCLARMDGSDDTWMLENNYHNSESRD